MEVQPKPYCMFLSYCLMINDVSVARIGCAVSVLVRVYLANRSLSLPKWKGKQDFFSCYRAHSTSSVKASQVTASSVADYLSDLGDLHSLGRVTARFKCALFIKCATQKDCPFINWSQASCRGEFVPARSGVMGAMPIPTSLFNPFKFKYSNRFYCHHNYNVI